MGGIALRDDTLVVDRAPNDLDDLAVQFTEILEELSISHVYVSGYVAILAGRSRATEDIDVLLEPLDEDAVNRLVDRLEAESLWGPAMPLRSMNEVLSHGDPMWVARADQMIPHLEVKVVDDAYDRASLDGRLTARITGIDTPIPIGPLELQIAYKLYLGTQTDIEDAVHLYTMFEESLRTPALERWVEKLGVEDAYAELQSH